VEYSEIITRALAEDLGNGDVTTRAVMQNQPSPVGNAVVLSKENGIFCGGKVFAETFRQVDPRLVVELRAEDGNLVKKGEEVISVSGKLSGILAAERTALNLLQRLTGISTMTSRFVKAVVGTNAKILDTRKTTPLLRGLEKYAVRTGGGQNHRSGLFDMILIKENHIAAAGGLTRALRNAVDFVSNSSFNVKIEIETKNLAEVEEVLESWRKGYYIQRVMLDNMPPETMIVAVQTVRSATGSELEIEASGNVSLDGVKEIAETGVDFISVGSLTHSVKAFDFSLICDFKTLNEREEK